MGTRHVGVWFPLREVMGFVRRSGRRVAISALGGLLLVAGAALLLHPGPGFLLIVAGFAALATEYAWTQRALNAARRRAEAARDAVLRRGRSGDAPGD